MFRSLNYNERTGKRPRCDAKYSWGVIIWEGDVMVLLEIFSDLLKWKSFVHLSYVVQLLRQSVSITEWKKDEHGWIISQVIQPEYFG